MRSRVSGKFLAWRSQVVGALMLLGGTAIGTGAEAGIVTAGAAPAINNKFQCKTETFSWGMTAGAAEAAVDRCTSWLMGPKSPAAAVPGRPALGAGQKDLQFDFRHLSSHAGEAPLNPAGGPLTVYAGRYAAGVKRAGGVVISHDPHSDVFIWSVTVPAAGPPATIKSEAKHVGDGFTPKWSYEPSVLGGPAVVNSVTATYKTDPAKEVPRLPAGKVTERQGGELPKGNSGESATDYHIRVTLGEPYFSDTTLGYVVGEPGSFELAELGIMNEALLDGAEYLIPMIFDVDATIDLYVAVDLMQWLSFPVPFAPGDAFDFTDGANASLAGFLVATSPFTFDPGIGFTSPDLWDGTGVVLGTVDGGNIPEPASWSLIAAGLLAIGAWYRWGRQPRSTR